MLKMRSNYLIIALCGLTLAVYSLQSQAAVVFDSYSDTEIFGTAVELGQPESSFNTYTYYPKIPASGSDSDTVEVGTGPSPYALAEAAVSLEIAPVLILGDATILGGNISATAHAVAADVRNNSADAYAAAIIDIDFSIDSVHSYIFSSVMMEARDDAELYYSMFDISTGTDIFSGLLNNSDDSPLFDGDLSAGDYNLYIEAIVYSVAAGGESFGEASADFKLSLTRVAPVVPVPAAVWLFSSGLLGMVFVSRRNHRWS